MSIPGLPLHNPQASVLPYAVNSDNFVSLNDDTADIEDWDHIRSNR